jgi:hypothetical protein
VAEANLAGLTPDTASALAQLQAAMAAKGITTHVNSAFRTYSDQQQLYANYQAGRAGKPLPYPDRGAVALAARPGYSPHESGVAFDLSPSDPSRRGEMDTVARSLGLATVAGDPGHYQLASWHGGKAADVPATGSTTMATDSAQPVDFRNSVYQTLIGKGLSPQQAMGAMYSLMGESGHGLDPGSFNPKDPGGAMGFAQWVGPRREGLQAVAKSIGTSETDPTAQLAYFNQELDGKYKGVIDNIKNNASSAADATRIWTADYEVPKVNNWQARFAQGSQIGKIGDDGSPTWTTPAATTTAPGATPAPDSATKPPQTVGDALAAITKEGTDAKGNATQSPLEKLGAAFAPKQAPTQSQPMLSAGGEAHAGAGMAGPSAQLMSNVIQQSSRPLSWSTAPYGSGTAGPQAAMPLGTTLNSTPQPRTLSEYALNPMYS